ncbi:hypothetical protein At15955_08720 [Agrobacterium tumefaciens]|jgi:hypothetical protein|nr:hypothetical protein Ach5_11770 [Agrobacterium tumefaciens]AYM15858.1 hypothetical protein At15955_08720 [Agrobacterium tumefaciens]AYM67093.1 hypothetical protein AtA6_08760 [Agrobacterium tumefaciens]MDP9760399.1 hypothetical protein [Agrobacterium tumefaciens]MDQ1222317.1 hypothetical protein [Agrobacterium sp. SORGH_AS_0745]
MMALFWKLPNKLSQFACGAGMIPAPENHEAPDRRDEVSGAIKDLLRTV